MLKKIIKGLRYAGRLVANPSSVSIRGDLVSFPQNISGSLRKALYSERFESEECDAMNKLLDRNDRVLDLGGSIGCVALTACHLVGDKNVTSIEANPLMADFAKTNFLANGFYPDYMVGLASFKSGKTKFKITEDFWASSLSTEQSDNDKYVDVEEIDCNEIIARKNINAIVCDIEGYEAILLPKLSLDSIDKIVIELHPKIYGDETASGLLQHILCCGFHFRPYKSNGNVYAFSRR